LGTYVSDTKYTHDGKPLEHDLSDAGRATLLSYNYEFGTQRLHESRVERETVASVDRDAVYSYDDVGNRTQDGPSIFMHLVAAPGSPRCKNGRRRAHEGWFQGRLRYRLTHPRAVVHRIHPTATDRTPKGQVHGFLA
jgi:hypothetical protein